MKRCLPLFAILALGACAQRTANQAPAAPPPPPPPPPIGGVTQTCALTIVFGSYAMGIDGPTRTRVEALLVADRGVAGFDTRRWGREGEITLCVRTRSGADANRLFQAVRAMIPTRPRGPITLGTSSGLSYETPPPRR